MNQRRTLRHLTAQLQQRWRPRYKLNHKVMVGAAPLPGRRNGVRGWGAGETGERVEASDAGSGRRLWNVPECGGKNNSPGLDSQSSPRFE